jgi:uncharacterized protein YceH (UPF0502 family)
MTDIKTVAQLKAELKSELEARLAKLESGYSELKALVANHRHRLPGGEDAGITSGILK